MSEDYYTTVDINLHKLHMFPEDMALELSSDWGTGVVDIETLIDILYENLDYDDQAMDKILDEIIENAYISLEEYFPDEY